MKARAVIFISLFLLIPLSTSAQQKTNLKTLTINVWSGTDYNGFFNFGLYENEERREKRFNLLAKQIKTINPDIIFIQEANSVGAYSNRLADELEMDNVYIICNAGIKLFGFGPPQNFKEGISILAKKNLRLRYYDTWKLAGSFGLYSSLFSIHFDESTFALAAKITVNNTPIFLINVHLSAETPYSENLAAEIKEKLKFNDDDERKTALKEWKENSINRAFEIEVLLEKIKELPGNIPIILGGDFNSTDDSQEMQKLFSTNLFTDSFLKSENKYGYTWFPETNENINYSTADNDASKEKRTGADLISSYYDNKPRRIDYIFYSKNFLVENIANNKVVLQTKEQGLSASDHYGVFSEVNLENVFNTAPKETDTLTAFDNSEWEAFPILAYDTDTGFGYGAKLFLLNNLSSNESIDVTVFNSTKGERWYRFVFSMPDYELRQGKVYPFAVDLVFDYDKYIKNPFYGIGNNSNFEARESYTKEPLELGLIFSRGFSTSFVAQAGIKYKVTRNFNFEPQSKILNLSNKLNQGKVYYTSLYASLLYDTRNSFINPSSGVVFWNEAELVNKSFLSNVNFLRFATWFQYYSILFYPKTVFAFRAGLQGLFGDDLPIQVLSSLGGNKTLRGSPQDRYIDKFSSLINAELRFPIVWRFGGVAGIDAGKVWNSFSKIDLKKWSINSMFGLRFYMDTFVIRVDIGLGKETTGFYFNFGQLF